MLDKVLAHESSTPVTYITPISFKSYNSYLLMNSSWCHTFTYKNYLHKSTNTLTFAQVLTNELGTYQIVRLTDYQWKKNKNKSSLRG